MNIFLTKKNFVSSVGTISKTHFISSVTLNIHTLSLD